MPEAKSSVFGKAPTAPTSQGVKVAFFFDGTGNNLDADVGNDEHSNVARLFRAHPQSDSTRGLFSYYIPGLGTRFKEIGDPGGTDLGLAFGGMGTARLDWAMRRFEERVGQSKGRTVHLSLFGFSRGAALARAFARMVADRCERGADGTWRFSHKQGKSPVRLYFMGLFDTVASVGVPMGVNNWQSLDLTTGALDLQQVLKCRHMYGSTLDELAFVFGGAPGADPASGMSNGHMSWADDLRIPEMVEDCLHMAAAHEIRNSFPLDSLAQGGKYPSNCREVVYPGAHSDVGGGYRLGEGARSQFPGSLLSLVPLRAMRAEAIRAGVPLLPEMPSALLKSDFAEDPASKAAFETMSRRFKLYMDTVGWGGKSLGDMVLSHMRLYYQWRFYKAYTSIEGTPTRDQTVLKAFEQGWAKEQSRLTQLTSSLRSEANSHKVMAKQLRESGAWMFGPGQKMYEEESKLADQKEDEYLTQKTFLDTMPSSDGEYAHNAYIYDRQLVMDARKLQAFAKKKGRDRLRPHYRAVLDAYEAQYERGQGLRNQELLTFFELHVHDSLVGFAKDATLPSDPRVIYIGGDQKLPYAMNSPLRRGAPSSALG
ncbi:T6SS phospholipase effector Tle1-like catalytic domain-containing protein [Archangium sp.]|uniref:T6SS phospholipase effector Tle1-like catalytic domain-containing protein n=1 Tax=Archangium sp. TaxID=1872627 RepID=UPI00389B05E9